MPVVSDHVEKEHKPRLGGGGPGKIPYRRGYGGSDDGDRGRRKDPSSRGSRLLRYRIAMAACIASVLVVFVGLGVALLARQATPHWNADIQRLVYDWKPVPLPYRRLWINSFVLLLSSVTLELARRNMARKAEFVELGIMPPRRRGDLPWLSLTVLLGIGFLAGQIVVWNNLRHQGFYLHANASSAFFYLLTGLHAAHLTGGLLALLYAATSHWLRRRFESQWVAVEVTAWYWHFMGILWLGIFALLHFASA